MSEHATTGDGVLTGLHLAAEVARTGKSLAKLAAIMTVYPQVLINVTGVDKDRTDDEPLVAAVNAVAAGLGGDRPCILVLPARNSSCASWSKPPTATARRHADHLAKVVGSDFGH